MLPSFTSSTRTFQGRSCEAILPAELVLYKARHVLFVTDRGVQSAGLIDRLKSIAEESCEQVETFADVMQDPTSRLMDDLGHRCRDSGIDVLIAVGGGACLDAAKGAALVASHGGSILELIGEDKVKRSPIPVIGIPTTAGTGSEISWHISVNDAERHLKVTVRSPLAVAATAILDPAMVASAPKSVVASAGMDALTHLLESYVGNVGRWDLTDALCLHAIGMVGRSLVPYWTDRANTSHALQMQIASCIGGLALSHSRTGIVHQMARPLGARFHAPHGLANAVLLPWCLEFTAKQEPARYALVARALSKEPLSNDDVTAANRLAQIVHGLNKAIEVPKSLSVFGVHEDALEELAQDALQGKQTVTNPCLATKADVVDIYRKALLDGARNG